LLLLWSLVLQIPSFAIERVGVDEIEKEKLRDMKGQHATISKVVKGEKGNPIRIDRDKDRSTDSQTKTLLYNPKGLCVLRYTLHSH
jgi:hypothetical protein